MTIQEKWNANFGDSSQIRTIVYGIGLPTKELIDSVNDSSIIGLYDRDKKEGSVYGYPILNIEDMKENQVERIVILAKEMFVKEIYRRIKDICSQYHVRVFNIDGEDLIEKYRWKYDNSHSYLEKNMEEIKTEILNHEIISFDIFDTLFMRRVYEPHDVFRIMDRIILEKKIRINNFSKFRILAEINTLNLIPNIYELYHEMQKMTGISDEIRKTLIQLELETEHSLLMSRDTMCELLRFAHEYKKRIFLISDMYIPKDILHQWLHEFGIYDYQDIFVSCEFHDSKAGNLFDLYQSRVQGNSYLHIGDNEIYDGQKANEVGIDTYIIKSAIDLFRISSIGYLDSDIKTLDDRILMGDIISKLYDNPFCLYDNKGYLNFGSMYDTSYVMMAPIIIGFFEWLINNCNANKVILAARDGYLLNKMLAIKSGINEAKDCYVLTSRIACNLCAVHSFEDFVQAVRRPKGISLQECMKQRFDLAIEEDEYEEIEVYEKYKNVIVRKSQSIKENYTRYLNSKGIHSNISYVFFDLVSSGTCLYLLGKRLELKLKGKFLYRYFDNNKDKSLLDIKSYLNFEQGSKFLEQYLKFEVMLTSFNGSFVRITNGGEYIFEEDRRDSEEIQIIYEMQKAVVDSYKWLKTYKSGNGLSLELLLKLAELLEEQACQIEDERKYILKLYDSFEGGIISVF